MKDDFKINLDTLKDTKDLGKRIAKFIKPKTFITLRGKLGVGKTTLVRFIISSLFNKNNMKVQSPTYSIVNVYELNEFKIWHYDLYRLKNKKEVYELDFDLALSDCIIVEWPEILGNLLPKNRIDIFINEDSSLKRSATVKIRERKN
ncbi:MAG: tRNA (adenosine(37)-N6)-threonylcarbamoyltransferase complex ATPase subunit type 1 TsaE [Alphaproteobacteria bacterium]|tara:strand:+ start:1854 stop:2294 length:441 start_codon:yes stop_codon:yes gene_type:complete